MCLLLLDRLPFEETLVVEQTELLRLILTPPFPMSVSISELIKCSGMGESHVDELEEGMAWCKACCCMWKGVE